MADIFISYSNQDREKVKVLAEAIQRLGWSVWWDRKIPFGKSFDKIIEQELDTARCVLVVWSENSATSDWVKTEAAEGARRGILLPILIDDVKIPLEFRRLHAANLTKWRPNFPDSEFELLVTHIEDILGLPAKELEEAGIKSDISIKNPYAVTHRNIFNSSTSETKKIVFSVSHKNLIRAFIIGIITFFLGISVNYSTSLESTIGLDTLFKIRGVRPPPSVIVVVAMDETSENRFGVGQDFRLWRKYHAKLIQQLQRQGAALVVFDLQFMKSDLSQDQELASAMQAAGNVLITDCLETIYRDDKNISGEKKCLESNGKLTQSDEEEQEREQKVTDPISIGLRKIRPTAVLARAALDHAPFYLSNGPENSIITEAWPFLDKFSESPTLPVVAWLAYSQRVGAFDETLNPSLPYSAWITERRKQCVLSTDNTHKLSFLLNKKMDYGNSFKEYFKNIICHEGSLFIDYYGPPQTLRIESYSDVYNGTASDLQGKVIFIGKSNRTFSPGKEYYFPTPFTDTQSGEMASVEIMATQFGNLLEGRFIASPLPPFLVLAIFGLIIGLLLSLLSGFTGFMATIFLSSAYAALSLWSFKKYGIWLPVTVPLLIQLPVAWLLSSSGSRLNLLVEKTLRIHRL